MEKSRDIPKIEKSPDILAQKKKKGFEGKICGNCHHAYNVKPAQIGLNTLLCKAHPPLFQMLQKAPGVLRVQEVPRLVVADNFCHDWMSAL